MKKIRTVRHAQSDAGLTLNMENEQRWLIQLKADANFREIALKKLQFRRVLQAIYHRAVDAACLVGNPIYKTIHQYLSLCDEQGWVKERTVFGELLLFLAKQNAVLVEDAQYITGIFEVVKRYRNWVKPFEDWSLRDQRDDAEKQFRSLLRTLLATYAVPTFLEKGFLEEKQTYIDLYIHIGSGKNVRTFGQLPAPLFGKAAAHFLETPENVTLEEAVRYCHVLGLGGDKDLASAILNSRMVIDFEHDAFWHALIPFFVRYRAEIGLHQIAPIVDFLYAQKFQITRRQYHDGIFMNFPPPKPDFTLQGRTPTSLMRLVDEWHIENKTNALHPTKWKPLSIGGWERTKGAFTHHIRQITTYTELSEEGREMHHCCRSYAPRCAEGTTSVWTYYIENEHGNRKRLLTIEVNDAKKVVQIRGKCNTFPKKEEFHMVDNWMHQAKIGQSAAFEMEMKRWA
jgi:PcfJ-like protein